MATHGHTIASAEEKAKPEIKSQLFRRTDSQLFTIALQIVQLCGRNQEARWRAA